MTGLKKISVPGKLMLAGEYAVLLEEGRALAFTVERSLDIYVRLSTDGLFRVQSALWPTEFVAASLASESLPETLRAAPLLRALAESQQRFKNPPLHLRVDSKLDMKGGMGSSSAVILGACMASALFGQAPDQPLAIAELAYAIQKKLQGEASGYDVLTQWLGALVSLQSARDTWPGPWQQHLGVEDNFKALIHPFVGGRGAPTIPVMQDTRRWLAEKNAERDLRNLSAELCASFLTVLTQEFTSTHFAELLTANAAHRKFFAPSPHFPRELAAALQKVKGCDQAWTFKTTGAGGEDAILLIGPIKALCGARQVLQERAWYPLNCPFSAKGLAIEDAHDPYL